MQNYIKINELKIPLSEETAKELQERFSKPEGLFKPAMGELFFYRNADGDNYNEFWENNDAEENRLAIGNVFRTKEEAEQKDKRDRAIQTVKTYIAEHFDIFTPNWENANQKKYIIYWDSSSARYTPTSHWVKFYSPFGYLATRENTEQLIKDCDKELKLILEV